MGKMSSGTKKQEVSNSAGAGEKRDEDGYSCSSDEDDDLVLEGVIVRNPDVVSSSSDEVSSESEEEAPKKELKRKDKGMDGGKKKKSKHNEPEIVNVEFTFCDMNAKFFHGIKTHLMSSTIYASQSSQLADLAIENVSVGTVISMEGDEDANVYGFASVLPVKTQAPSVDLLKKQCLQHCADAHRLELETVLSGKTRRPAGFLLQGRMINLPLEIVEVLHQQLVLDMDWAVENAEGGEEERKSLDFGAFVRMAPSYAGRGSQLDFKYFEDEVFASNAEFVYSFDAPKSFASEEKQLCSVIVMTKTGHRKSMKDIAKLVHGR